MSIRLFKSDTASGDLLEEEDELPEDMLLLDELPIDEEPRFEEELPLLIDPRLLPGIELELPPESELLLPGVEPGRLMFGEDMLLLGDELFEKLLEELLLDELPKVELLLDELPNEEPLPEPLVERAEESVLPGIELEPEFEERLLPGVDEELFHELFDEDEPKLDEPEDKLLEPLFEALEELLGVESPLLSFVLRSELIFPDWLVLTCPF